MSSFMANSVAWDVWSIFLIVLFFGGSIFVHELGHFLAARRRGVRVERFSIGFGPAIVSRRGRDGVEYRLSWLPLGGYVLLPQLAEMPMIEGEAGTDAAHLPPLSYGTQMLVLAAGAAFNVLFAFLLACIVWRAGLPTSADFDTTRIGIVLPTITLPDRTPVPSPASEAGLQPGDVVRAIDGRRVADWPDLQQTLFLGTDRAADGRRRAVFTIERGDRTLDVTVYPVLTGDERMRTVGIVPAQDLVVAAVAAGSPAAGAGVAPGDRIAALDGAPVFHFTVLADFLRRQAGQPFALTVRRGGRLLPLRVPARPPTAEAADLGLTFQPSFKLLYPDPFTQLGDDARQAFGLLAAIINRRSDVSVADLSGPVGIVSAFYAAAQSDVRVVLWLTIVVNISLAILNLLPIPLFDGGHMLFATIARLRGRSLPPEFVMTVQSVFFVLIISLFAYVTFHDVRRNFRRAEPAPPPAPRAAPAPAP